MQKLIDAGYKMWLKEENERFQKKNYQKTVNQEGVPLCKCNDGLFLNVEECTTFFEFSASTSRTFEVSLAHKNQQDEWCDLRIYGLSEEDIESSLDKLEEKLLNMWKVFNE